MLAELKAFPFSPSPSPWGPLRGVPWLTSGTRSPVLPLECHILVTVSHLLLVLDNGDLCLVAGRGEAGPSPFSGLRVPGCALSSPAQSRGPLWGSGT